MEKSVSSQPFKSIRMAVTLTLMAISCTLITTCNNTTRYVYNEGPVYGTYYRIIYESPEGKDFHEELRNKFEEYDASFSTFNPNSAISKINSNTDVMPDQWFVNCFKRAQAVSEITGGAFDITVAPLVNAWGFGFKHKEKITSSLVDSLLQITGFQNVRLESGKIIKDDPAIMLDMSAIAKGYTCDLIAEFLTEKGCKNYLVEIGGEVVAKGVNEKGRTWKIGISKPDESGILLTQEIQAVVQLPDRALATSGNYRNFYIEDGQKFAHTIDPKTGYPVQHSLLSATVLADDCMTADAFATAFMVMGLEKSVALAKTLNYLDVYFIYADETGFNKIYMSENFSGHLVE